MSSALQKAAESMGLEILPESETHTNRMHVRSESSNRLYVISQAKSSGEWQCSCPGWAMKKPGKPRGCKHLNAILPALDVEKTVGKIGAAKDEK
jgi:hypothetical protein